MARVYNIPTGPDADAEVLAVSSDELPPDANEVLDIIREFTTETWTPPLATYCDLAAEYTRRGLHVEAGKVLRAGLDPSKRIAAANTPLTGHECWHPPQSWPSS